MCSVIWHIVEHVEEHIHREFFDRRFWQIFRFAHLVARWNAEFMLEAVTVILVFQRVKHIVGDGLLGCRLFSLWWQ